ncbi:unnamed protein product [Caenorhabditis auriculariae]|uniref:UBC core domain-containing protein n=1 Tax=Caenorhabditis auriculariae TaxID=2777116 RepID=A0A8S1H8D7_9PELO|nr:unnamed protein product [Caenorhabditis auriculariae]
MTERPISMTLLLLQMMYSLGVVEPDPNTVSPQAARRLQKDLEKFKQEPADGIEAAPCEENILVWHYCLRGSPDTVYQGGYYHGKLIFPVDFPWKPPAIIMITPNGRFHPNMRLCLSISDYHPESWNPGWTVTSILVGLHSFMNEDDMAAGTVNEPPEICRQHAASSKGYNLANPEFVKMFPSLAARFSKELEQMAKKKQAALSTTVDEPVKKKLKTGIAKAKADEVQGEGLTNRLGNAVEDDDVIVLD